MGAHLVAGWAWAYPPVGTRGRVLSGQQEGDIPTHVQSTTGVVADADG